MRLFSCSASGDLGVQIQYGCFAPVVRKNNAESCDTGIRVVRRGRPAPAIQAMVGSLDVTNIAGARCWCGPSPSGGGYLSGNGGQLAPAQEIHLALVGEVLL